MPWVSESLRLPLLKNGLRNELLLDIDQDVNLGSIRQGLHGERAAWQQIVGRQGVVDLLLQSDLQLRAHRVANPSLEIGADRIQLPSAQRCFDPAADNVLQACEAVIRRAGNIPCPVDQ